MKCDKCSMEDAAYLIRKTPPGTDVPKEQLHLCPTCASKFIQKDTISVIRIKKDSGTTR